MSLDTSTSADRGTCAAARGRRPGSGCPPCRRRATRAARRSAPASAGTAARSHRGCRACRAGCPARCRSPTSATIASSERLTWRAFARDLRHALLVVVELLERHDRQEDVVLGEAEQARRIVHQHVGVEHEEARLLVGRAAQPRGRRRPAVAATFAAGCRCGAAGAPTGARAAGRPAAPRGPTSRSRPRAPVRRHGSRPPAARRASRPPRRSTGPLRAARRPRVPWDGSRGPARRWSGRGGWRASWGPWAAASGGSVVAGLRATRRTAGPRRRGPAPSRRAIRAAACGRVR